MTEGGEENLLFHSPRLNQTRDVLFTTIAPAVPQDTCHMKALKP